APGRAHDRGSAPRFRHLPRRRHGVARPRRDRAPSARLLPRRLRLAERHLRQPQADRVPQADRRRRAPSGQIQTRVPEQVMATPDPAMALPEPPEAPSEPPRQKAVTIGAVCKALVQEFPDISISKIRYLEDQKLLSPRRTQGGYRLYTQSDIQRLRTILRLQR